MKIIVLRARRTKSQKQSELLAVAEAKFAKITIKIINVAYLYLQRNVFLNDKRLPIQRRNVLNAHVEMHAFSSPFFLDNAGQTFHHITSKGHNATSQSPKGQALHYKHTLLRMLSVPHTHHELPKNVPR